MMKNVMIDIETLGVEPGNVILSIGACVFHGLKDDGYIEETRFYQIINIESHMGDGRTIDPDTLRWWMMQSNEPRKIFLHSGISMKDTLMSFYNWFKTHCGNDFFIWSNTKMDIVMMEYEFRQNGIDIPWSYNKFRETKSYKMGISSLVEINKDDIENYICPGVFHNADYDAQWQAVEIGMYMDAIDRIQNDE